MVASSRQAPPNWAKLVIRSGDGLARQVLQSHRLISVSNYVTDSGASDYLLDIASSEALYAMCAAPLERDGQVFGIAYGVLRHPDVIDKSAQRHLANVARLLAHSVSTREADALKSDCPATESSALLSAREVRILHLLGDGLSTREIAASEFLAVNTVRNYVQGILWKLGVNSRLQAIAVARRRSLI